MAWPNPLRRKTPFTRSAWGFVFELTPLHPTLEDTEPLKHSYDTLGEEAYLRLTDIRESDKAQQQAENGDSEPAQKTSASTKKDDLYVLLRDNADLDPKLGQLWREMDEVPSWVDWEQISRGQDCFYRYGGPMLTSLAFQSLVGGFGAARVVETLARTGGFSTKVARHRLFETTQHILQCTRSISSIQPGGEGHASSIRVRLLHAAVRRRIMSLAEQRPTYYDVENWGIPINDLDSIATIITFSSTLIWLGLPRQGIWMREQEIEDYIALWRYVAYLTGTPTNPFENPQKARAWMEILMLNEIRPTLTSQALAENVLSSLQGQPPTFSSKAFLQANVRWLNGNELADAMAIGRPSLYYWALMAGQCIFLMAVIYLYRSIPYLDRRKNQALRKIFWQVIVESKAGLGRPAMFEFKYVPEYSKITRSEAASDPHRNMSAVEKRNWRVFVISCCVFGMFTYGSIRYGISCFRRLARSV